MAAKPTRRKGWELFAHPAQQNQRRYEALRAYLYEGASLAQAAARFGYTSATLNSLARDLRAGKLALFAPAGKPGRKHAPKKDRARARVIQLRRDGLSVYEISTRLAVEGIGLNRTGVGQILREEGFGRLLRDPADQASTSPATSGRDTRLPKTSVLDFDAFPQRVHTAMAGLLLAVPDLVALDLPALVRAAGYPGTKPVPAISYLLSLLALKLTGTRRVSHVDDLLGDPAAGLFAGLGVLPKKTALTDYSYRLAHDQQRAFLAALDTRMIAAGLATSDQAIFDLDFHAVMHWGQDPALEKHYVPRRSQRTRSVLTFFAQDSGTHNLVYAGADLSKATQAREPIAFCDHWKAASGADPHLLILDSRVTTQPVLGELDQRGVKFLTPRPRSPGLARQINQLPPTAFTPITLDRSGKHTKPRVHEMTGVKLTNDHDKPVKALIEHYARRMTIEQRLAEIIRSFCLDALSSAVNLNVDLDVVLCVLAQAVTAAFRLRLPGNYDTATPDTLQRRFLDTPGEIINTDDTIIVKIDRRAYSPVLRSADLPAATPVPWWAGRRLRFDFT